MDCPKCGAEVEGEGELCTECRALMLLRASRKRAMSAALIPIVASILLLCLVAAYLLRARFEGPLIRPVTTPAPSAVSRAPEVPHSLERAAGALRFDGATHEVRALRVVHAGTAVHVQVFTERGERTENLRAQLRLPLPAGELSNCAEIAEAELWYFRDGVLLAPMTVENGLPLGISKLTCTLDERGARPHISLSLETSGIQLEYEGVLHQTAAAEIQSLSTENYYQLALWNPRRGALELGFYPEAPTLQDLEQFHSQQTLLRGQGMRPAFAMLLGLPEDSKQLSMALVRSFELYAPATAPSESPVALQSSGVLQLSASLQRTTHGRMQESNMLDSFELIRLHLQGMQSVLREDGLYTVLWNIPISAALIDTQQPLHTKILLRMSSYSSAVPQATRGQVQVNASSVSIADSLAFYYRKSRNLTIGLYTRALEAKERAALVKERSLWTAQRELKPTVVLSFQLDEQGVPSQIEVTMLRSFLGEFYFEGDRDRETFHYKAAEIGPTNLLSFARAPAGPIALRLRGARRGMSANHFFWDISVVGPVLEFDS